MEELVEAHWKWVKGLIDSFESDPKVGLNTVEYVYKTAFKHGFKHGFNTKSEALT